MKPFAIGLLSLLVALSAWAHGNNPKFQWVGVNLAGITVALPGDVADYIAVLYPDVLGPAEDCAELALQICGEGNVCCFCIIGHNGDHSCSFSCQDDNGDCEPCPECDDDTTLPVPPVAR